jgi:opacity protein-like surface antigen
MRKFIVGTAALAAALLSSGSAVQAQGIIPFAVEARGGFAVPQGDLKDSFGANGGWGYGLNARMQIMPLISVYAGWETYAFDMDADEAETNDSGIRAGAQVSLPVSAITGFSPYAFAGVLYNRTSVDVVTGEAESDDGFGWEAGAGASIPFAPTLSFTPGVRYRTHSAEFSSAGAVDGEATVSYLVVDLGLKLGI